MNVVQGRGKGDLVQVYFTGYKNVGLLQECWTGMENVALL